MRRNFKPQPPTIPPPPKNSQSIEQQFNNLITIVHDQLFQDINHAQRLKALPFLERELGTIIKQIVTIAEIEIILENLTDNLKINEIGWKILKNN